MLALESRAITLGAKSRGRKTDFLSTSIAVRPQGRTKQKIAVAIT